MEHDANPTIVLSRADAAEEIPGNNTGLKWSASKDLDIGKWKVEYRSGNEVCRMEDLKAVLCMDGFEEKAGKCFSTAKGTV